MLALMYCTALETSHSLMLGPRLMKDLWPVCEQVRTAPRGKTLTLAMLCLLVDTCCCSTSMQQLGCQWLNTGGQDSYNPG